MYSVRPRVLQRSHCELEGRTGDVHFPVSHCHCVDSQLLWHKVDCIETFLKFNKLAEILRQGFEGRLETNDLWAALSNATSDVWEIREIEVDPNESRYVFLCLTARLVNIWCSSRDRGGDV